MVTKMIIKIMSLKINKTQEGKTESESKQDKPAVGDKTAKDEDNNSSGGGEVGAGGDMPLNFYY